MPISLQTLDSAQQLFDSTPLPVCVLENNLKIEWRNQAAEKTMPILRAPDGLLSILSQDVVRQAVQRLSSGEQITLSGQQIPGFLNDVRLIPILVAKNLEGALAVFFLSKSVPGAIYPTDLYGLVSATFERQFRTPVSSIFSSLDVIRRNEFVGRIEELQPYLDNISRNSYTILRTNLLMTEYMKYTYGENPLQYKVLDIRGFCEDLAVRLEALLPDDASFSFVMEQDNCITSLDPKKITLLLSNLWDNSCRFRRKEPLELELEVHITKTHVIFHAKDNGRGIPTHILPEVCSPFYSYTEESIPFAGNGLGLTVCKLIAEQHGGTLTISPNTETGITVSIGIPKRVPDGNTEVWLRNTLLPGAVHDRFSELTLIMMDTCPRIPAE